MSTPSESHVPDFDDLPDECREGIADLGEIAHHLPGARAKGEREALRERLEETQAHLYGAIKALAARLPTPLSQLDQVDRLNELRDALEGLWALTNPDSREVGRKGLGALVGVLYQHAGEAHTA